MTESGLHIIIGVRDWPRNPAIQGVADNLEIAKKKYKVHTNILVKENVLPYVSDLIGLFE